ncbi:hypothetical protein O0L34_g9247 [Tuta absoluta]|nr:hypothetical protein O0L34_g9247 [Tuta absoluta]
MISIIFFTPSFEKSFTPSNIRAGFRIAGICPFNRTAVNHWHRQTLSQQKLKTTNSTDTFQNDNSAAKESNTNQDVSLETDDSVCDPLQLADSQFECTKQPVQLKGDNILDNVPGQTTESPIISQQKLKATDSTDVFQNDNSAAKDSNTDQEYGSLESDDPVRDRFQLAGSQFECAKPPVQLKRDKI